MSVPWNKTAYQYADELEDEIVRLKRKIKELNETIHRTSAMRSAIPTPTEGDDKCS